jgi:hypothetical protein
MKKRKKLSLIILFLLTLSGLCILVYIFILSPYIEAQLNVMKFVNNAKNDSYNIWLKEYVDGQPPFAPAPPVTNDRCNDKQMALFTYRDKDFQGASIDLTYSEDILVSSLVQPQKGYKQIAVNLGKCILFVIHQNENDPKDILMTFYDLEKDQIIKDNYKVDKYGAHFLSGDGKYVFIIESEGNPDPIDYFTGKIYVYDYMNEKYIKTLEVPKRYYDAIGYDSRRGQGRGDPTYYMYMAAATGVGTGKAEYMVGIDLEKLEIVEVLYMFIPGETQPECRWTREDGGSWQDKCLDKVGDILYRKEVQEYVRR